MPKADISTSYNLNIIILLSSYPFISLNLIFTIKSHLQSYPYPNNINTSWNIGFLLGLSIVLQLITGILLSLHYTPHINYSYYSIMYIIRYYKLHISDIRSNRISLKCKVIYLLSLQDFIIDYTDNSGNNITIKNTINDEHGKVSLAFTRVL